MSFTSWREWTITALFVALITVGTLAIQIPIPATQGFINFGDAFIFIAGAILGPWAGMLAGGIGSALADTLSGFFHYAPWTLVIKGIEGLLVGLIVYRHLGRSKVTLSIVGMALAGMWMVFGYFIAGSLMYGWKVALTAIPSDIVQALGSILIAAPLLKPLQKALRSGNNY